ncbi:MAG TPA: hypothetical protein VE954_16405 [Oligoflexus sp.]|uniref:hypothetical protein n=1 Tax=Oligoflexus sp. TaxID=1971216 RepID=UPI002D754B9F|nr:hypothetical protein [Oligoflexus sp.]HYX34681.1 hypothetical protein [Oligoflexus sp.]
MKLKVLNSAGLILILSSLIAIIYQAMQPVQGYDLLSLKVPPSSYWDGPTITSLQQAYGPGVMVLALFIPCYLLGVRLLRSFSPVADWDLIRHVGALVPGYFICIALNRLITFLLPNEYAWPAIIMLYAGVIIYSLYSKDLQVRWRPKFVVSALIIVIVALVYQVQYGTAHVVGDGNSYSFKLLEPKGGEGSLFQSGVRFPVFGQHYDELMFLYPALYAARHVFEDSNYFAELLPFWWSFNAIMRLAVFAFLLAALRSFREIGFWAALILTLFVHFGPLMIHPTQRALIFDSGNPLAYCLHIGRSLGAVLPVMALSRYLDFSQTRSFRPVDSRVLPFLFGIGLAATTISNQSFTIALLALPFLGHIRNSSHPLRFAGALSCMSAGLMIALFGAQGSSEFYQSHGLRVYLLGFILFLIGFFLSVDLSKASFVTLWKIKRRISPAVLSFLIGNFLALFLLGNIALEKILQLLPLWGRIAPTLKVRELVAVASNQAAFGPSPYCPLVIAEQSTCRSWAEFSVKFGLPVAIFLIVLLSWYFFRRSRVSEREPDPEGIYREVCFCAVALLLTYFIFDFMNGSASAWLGIWVKTRLFEPWYYSLLIMGLIALLKKSRALDLALASWMVLWLVIFQYKNDFVVFRQLLVNVQYLAGLL